MSDQVRSSRFQALFESALRDYEQKTKITLSKHPLAEKLEKCDSVESTTGLLLDQAPPLSNSQGSDKKRRSIKSTVSVLYALSATAVFSSLRKRYVLGSLSYSLCGSPITRTLTAHSSDIGRWLLQMWWLVVKPPASRMLQTGLIAASQIPQHDSSPSSAVAPSTA